MRSAFHAAQSNKVYQPPICSGLLQDQEGWISAIRRDERESMRRHQKFYVALFVAFAIVGCGTVAITGRTQLNLVSDSILVSAANENFSKLMSAASSKGAVLSSTESPAAANVIDLVNRVSNKVIDASGLRGKYNWQVTVLKSNVPNAFVMPNGKIVVYTGILPIAKNEAGLAAVIGHEIAHVVAKHSAERMSQSLLAQATLDAVDAAVAAKNQKNQPVIAAALGLGAQYGILLPFSREHESEADRIGQIYMAKAGYDPAEAIAVWERMASNSGKSKFEFVSTHPSNDTRQAQLKQWLPDAQLYYADRGRPLPSNLTEVQTARMALAQKAALSPVALQPEILEGYWYKRKSSSGIETTYRYDKIDSCEVGQCVSINSSANGKEIMTTDYRLVKLENANGTWTKFSPPVRPIRFPARVGDSWEDTIEVQTSDGKKRTVLFKSQIVGYESVNVPAGIFMAYKTISSAGGSRFFEGWYVPEARAFIKSTTFNSSGQETTTVLVDFQKSDDLSRTLAGSEK